MTDDHRSETRFSWFGTPVCVRSDDPGVGRMFRALDSGARPSGDPIVFDVELSEAALEVRGPYGSTRLDPAHAAPQAYSTILRQLLGTVDDHFVFHATTVERDGRALLIAGPSSFGKTTLTVHLALRGFSVLSEDLTFLDRASGRVIPFRRPMTIRPGTRRTLRGDQVDALARGVLRRDADVWSVDIGKASIPRSERPATPVVLAVMRPTGTGSAMRSFRWFSGRVREGCMDALDALRDLPGTGRVLASPVDPWALAIEIDDTAAIDSWLKRFVDDVVLAVKHTGGAPDFDGAPAAAPIGSFQAGLEISQEMLNRQPGSGIASEFDGRETHLVAEVAGLLRDVDTYALSPGRLDDTLDILENAFGRAVGRSF